MVRAEAEEERGVGAVLLQDFGEPGNAVPGTKVGIDVDFDGQQHALAYLTSPRASVTWVR